MKYSFAKRNVARSVAVALAGGAAALASGPVLASDIRTNPFHTVTNDADPGNVVGARQLLEPLTFRTPAGETKVTLSGYVRGSFSYDFEDDVGDSFVVSSIPTVGESGDGHFRAHARRSRFRIRSSTDTGGGNEVKTHLEGDFFGVGGNESFSNSTALRLRLAYITVGKWTFGQNWTNFMDFVAYPTTVDFFGPAGKAFKRQGQIRYTMDNGLSFSLENPETDGFGSAGRLGESRGGFGEDLLPDITAAWRGGPGGMGGNYEFAAVVRSLGVNRPEVVDDAGVVTQTEIDESVGGFGLLAAGAWELETGTLSASIVTGDGVGSFIINGFGNDVFVDESGDVNSITSTGVSLSYNHKWSDTASSLISFGGFTNNDDDGENNGIDNLQTFHVNYIWDTASGVNYGIEAIIGRNATVRADDPSRTDSGTTARLAFGAQFNF